MLNTRKLSSLINKTVGEANVAVRRNQEGGKLKSLFRNSYIDLPVHQDNDIMDIKQPQKKPRENKIVNKFIIYKLNVPNTLHKFRFFSWYCALCFVVCLSRFLKDDTLYFISDFYLEWEDIQAKVIQANILANNGIIHIIDHVLFRAIEPTTTRAPSRTAPTSINGSRTLLFNIHFVAFLLFILFLLKCREWWRENTL